MAAQVRAGPSGSQQPGTAFRSSTRVARAQIRGLCSLLFSGLSQELDQKYCSHNQTWCPSAPLASQEVASPAMANVSSSLLFFIFTALLSAIPVQLNVIYILFAGGLLLYNHVLIHSLIST